MIFEKNIKNGDKLLRLLPLFIVLFIGSNPACFVVAESACILSGDDEISAALIGTVGLTALSAFKSVKLHISQLHKNSTCYVWEYA